MKRDFEQIDDIQQKVHTIPEQLPILPVRDAVIFPNHGGRFGYTPETCRAIAAAALGDWAGLRPSTPTPAGGMSLERVPEMLDFYGADTMLLIGGALLGARERLVEATGAFVAAVERHAYG